MSNKNYAQGKDGRDGRDGRNGQDGRDGRDCKTVENKTDVKQAAETSWKECAWNNLNEGKDVGLVKVRNVIKTKEAGRLEIDRPFQIYF